eukprot:gene9552-10557_t
MLSFLVIVGCLLCGYTGRSVVLESVTIFDSEDVSRKVVTVLRSRGLLAIASLSSGSVLHLALRLDSSESFLLDATKEICLSLDGEECQCFTGSLQTAAITIGPSCALGDNWSSTSLAAIIKTEGQGSVSSTPLLLQNLFQPPSQPVDQVTLVLPLARADVDRAKVLFYSLHSLLSGRTTVLEMLVYCPDEQVFAIRQALAREVAGLAFPVHFRSEGEVFRSPRSGWLNQVHPYAVQMAIKLAAARQVRTAYFLTLDADVVALRDFSIDHLLFSNTDSQNSLPRVVYRPETWLVHKLWWQGSAALLGLPQEELPSASTAFGVTPALLSTWGALSTLSLLRKRFIKLYNTVGDEWEGLWLRSFGRETIWTEYSLYRLALDHLHVFPHLHLTEEEAGVYLSCEEVWYAHDLPWKAEQAYGNTSCLFSLVQSSSAVDPQLIRSALLSPSKKS